MKRNESAIRAEIEKFEAEELTLEQMKAINKRLNITIADAELVLIREQIIRLHKKLQGK